MRSSGQRFLDDVTRQGIAGIRLVEWTLTDTDELALRSAVGFRYCSAVDIELDGEGERWRFSRPETEGTLQLSFDPNSSVEATVAGMAASSEPAEVLDHYRGLPVEAAGFGSMSDGSVVSLEIRFAGADNLYLFACDFDDEDTTKLAAGEEPVVLCTSRQQAQSVGLEHRPVELGEARF